MFGKLKAKAVDKAVTKIAQKCNMLMAVIYEQDMRAMDNLSEADREQALKQLQKKFMTNADFYGGPVKLAKHFRINFHSLCIKQDADGSKYIAYETIK